MGIIVFAVVLMWAQQRWAHNFQLIEHDRYFWVTIVVVFLGTVVALEVLWHVAWRRSCKYSPMLAFAVMLGTYHVFYPIANGALDRRAAEQRVYVIERRYCSAAKSDGRAHIWLRSRATPDDEIEYRVSRRRCLDAKDGEELVLDVKPGFFGTAWVPRYEAEWW
ncbi:MAG: hypothetical protein ACREMI_00645 [Gemmatimonadales bacterium]